MFLLWGQVRWPDDFAHVAPCIYEVLTKALQFPLPIPVAFLGNSPLSVSSHCSRLLVHVGKQCSLTPDDPSLRSELLVPDQRQLPALITQIYGLLLLFVFSNEKS